jgi:hypothetical protein
MIETTKRHYWIAGSYPKNPLLRQNRRVTTPPGSSDYGHVDLAMREPVRIINEDLNLRTFASCEYHPCDLDKRHYEVFHYNGKEYDYTYRPPYRSYIALDLGRYHRVLSLMDFLKKSGFTEEKDTSPQGKFDVLKDDDLTDTTKIMENHLLKANIPIATLGLSYSYYATGDPADGRCSIDVTPAEKRHIRRWSEWDKIRDTGWEHWLEILYNYIKEEI